jgi:signal peptidase I
MRKSVFAFSLGVLFGIAVSFSFRPDNPPDQIKRVIAERGDRIEVQKNEIYLNGQKMPKPKRLIAEY